MMQSPEIDGIARRGGRALLVLDVLRGLPVQSPPDALPDRATFADAPGIGVLSSRGRLSCRLTPVSANQEISHRPMFVFHHHDTSCFSYCRAIRSSHGPPQC